MAKFIKLTLAGGREESVLINEENIVSVTREHYPRYEGGINYSYEIDNEKTRICLVGQKDLIVAHRFEEVEHMLEG
jgi:hypothetical protein